MPRSIWNGCLAVGDLRVPVKLFGAVQDRSVRFREVHAKEGARLEHRRIDPETGREVPYERIVRGFEVGDGEYVVLSDDELRGVEGRARKLAEIEQFVPAEQVDPVFYEKPYYLGPRDSDEGYRLLHDALARSDRVGLGRIVLRTRERLVALRALGDGVLALSTLRFPDEVVDPDSFEPPGSDVRGASAREREMAATLVQRLTVDFDAGDFDDDHRAALLELIERKAEGEAIEPPDEGPAGAPDDLAAALEATLASVSRRRRRTRGEHASRRASARRRRGEHAPRRGGRRAARRAVSGSARGSARGARRRARSRARRG